MRIDIKRLAAIGILSATYIALSYFTIRSGQLTITFTSLPLYIAVFYLGLKEGIAVSLIGGLIEQLCYYGISATTPLWLLPNIIRLLVAFGLAYWYKKLFKQSFEKDYRMSIIICSLSALACTATTTAVMALDAYIFDYFSWTYIVTSLGMRLTSTVMTAILVGVLISPILNILKQKRRFNE